MTTLLVPVRDLRVGNKIKYFCGTVEFEIQQIDTDREKNFYYIHHYAGQERVSMFARLYVEQADK